MGFVNSLDQFEQQPWNVKFQDSYGQCSNFFTMVPARQPCTGSFKTKQTKKTQQQQTPKRKAYISLSASFCCVHMRRSRDKVKIPFLETYFKQKH